MNKRISDLIEQARQLTPQEQQELLARLPLELDVEPDGTPEEIEEAWIEEVERRIAAHERGETASIPHEEAIATVRKLVRRS